MSESRRVGRMVGSSRVLGMVAFAALAASEREAPLALPEPSDRGRKRRERSPEEQRRRMNKAEKKRARKARQAAWIREKRWIALRQEYVDQEKARGARMFMGTPDHWFDDRLWCCPNGHVGRCYLKSEALGIDACLSCFEPVRLFPPDLTEVEFRRRLGLPPEPSKPGAGRRQTTCNGPAPDDRT